MSFFSQIIDQISGWSSQTFALLTPAGTIAAQERHLMFVAIGLMLIVVIPVFILTVAIAIRYREGNTKAKFTPNWDHNRIEEFIWWGVPIAIIGVIAVITWKSTHALDPFKPLPSVVPPITIEAVALNWKWLFIYPEQGIATVNYLKFPVNTPIAFRVAADAPMNSLWIPKLSGQMYAMPGMVTQLHIAANKPGAYRGLSANFSGKGFAGMSFQVVAVSKSDFDAWVDRVATSKNALDRGTYAELAKPSVDEPVVYFTLADPNLFSAIVMKYMLPGGMKNLSDGVAPPSMMEGMGNMSGMPMMPMEEETE